MSVVSSAANYVGRTFDVVAFQGAAAPGEARLINALSLGNGGEICTGTDKLAQRWLIEFLTVAGSLAYLPARGCSFMQLLQTGQLRTTLDAEQAFYLSAAAVQQNLRAEEQDSDPDDERMGTATLLSLTISGDGISASIQLTSQAGTSRQVILPIDVTVKS